MALENRQKDEWRWYVCGQCRDKQYYTPDEEPPVPCPDCGWNHKDRKKYDIPSEIKLDISKY